MFVGRVSELFCLNEACSREGLKLITIQGGRRVGKTALLKEFSKERKTIYLKGFNGPNDIVLSALSELCEEIFPTEIFSSRKFSDIESALRFFFAKGMVEDYVLIIDDYDALAEAFPLLSIYILSLLEQYREKCRFSIIISGNSDKKLNLVSDLVLIVKPFTLKECVGVLISNYGLNDIFKIYSITGAYPSYVVRFLEYRNIEDGIEALFLRDFSYFSCEIDNILFSSFRSPSNYKLLLYYLASGVESVSKLSENTGISTPHLSYMLSSLEDIGLIEQQYTAASKRGVWKICSPLVLFYFRFSYPTAMFTPSKRLLHYKEKSSGFYRERFEELFRESIGLFFPDRIILSISDWKSKNPITKEKEYIISIAKTQDGCYIVGNVYWDKCIDNKDVEKLRAQSDRAINVKRKTYLVYSDSGYKLDGNVKGAWILLSKKDIEKTLFL